MNSPVQSLFLQSLTEFEGTKTIFGFIKQHSKGTTVNKRRLSKTLNVLKLEGSLCWGKKLIHLQCSRSIPLQLAPKHVCQLVSSLKHLKCNIYRPETYSQMQTMENIQQVRMRSISALLELEVCRKARCLSCSGLNQLWGFTARKNHSLTSWIQACPSSMNFETEISLKAILFGIIHLNKRSKPPYQDMCLLVS